MPNERRRTNQSIFPNFIPEKAGGNKKMPIFA
jgi:hypothetical protein